MSFKHFPKLSNVVSQDPQKKQMSFAVVMQGRILATNGFMGVDIALKSFIDDPEQIKNLEGKALDIEALKLIERDGALFENDCFITLKGLKTTYSGDIDEKREIVLHDLQTSYLFPNLDAVFPTDKTAVTDIEDLGINPKQLQKIADCLSSPNIKLRWYAHNKAYLIHAGDEENQRAVMMPVIFAK